MMKRMVSVFLAVIMLLSLLPAAYAMVLDEAEENSDGGEEYYEDPGITTEELLGINWGEWPKTMYVYTENRGALLVRSEPAKGDNVIQRLDYGAEVIVEGPVAVNADWSVIQCSNGPQGVGYVMTRFLVSSRPGDADRVKAEKQQQTEQKKAEQQKQAEQQRQEAAVQSFNGQALIGIVRAPRPSGWVDLRERATAESARVASLPDGRELTIIGESGNWYSAIDSESGKIGFISKKSVNVYGGVPQAPEPVKQQMGRLNVNGEFALQCSLPEGYVMQITTATDTKISALITPADNEKPILRLSIAYNELYSDIDRMNDLDHEQLIQLEESFTDMNDVEFTYSQTAYGTDLLIVREIGADTDYVDVLSVYKGYEIEFVMSPNPQARNQTLTDAQIQMCVDFLSELDFIEA